jgi:NADPH-dependent ferric siderophore reductase
MKLSAERRMRQVTVLDILALSPTMRRFRLGSGDLTGFLPALPAQWIKIFFGPCTERPVAGRVYTIRKYDPERKELDVDFVLHGEGPGSNWAENAAIGDVIRIAGPRAGYSAPASAEWIALFGDETALPAIASIVEAVGNRIPAFPYIEVPPGSDGLVEAELSFGTEIHCISKAGSASAASGLVSAARGFTCRPGNGEIWIAAEASIAQLIKNHFLIHSPVPRERIRSAGYWKRGVADHRN